jgi:hypothetical protein
MFNNNDIVLPHHNTKKYRQKLVLMSNLEI